MDSALDLRIVDAFTHRPFTGNPAAVVLPSEGSPPDDMPAEALQLMAREMNLSETAFPGRPDKSGVRRLRWFTPTTEVSLCGHATLAAAHALFEAGAAETREGTLRFASTSGPLQVHRSIRDGQTFLRLDFPADPPQDGPMPPGLAAAMGIFEGSPFAAGARCGVVQVPDEAFLMKMRPDMEALRRVPIPVGMLGVSATAPSEDPDTHFVSRFFGPWVGVPEDPVTGMAHCALGPWWGRRLDAPELEARQGGSPRFPRGGRLTVRMDGSRVHLLGQAVTVLEGRIRAPVVRTDPAG